MKKILQWLGLSRKIYASVSWSIGNVVVTIEAYGATPEEVVSVLNAANKIAAEKEKVVRDGK